MSRAIMAITTKSSISVNAGVRRGRGMTGARGDGGRCYEHRKCNTPTAAVSIRISRISVSASLPSALHLELLHFLPDVAVRLLVEWRAAGWVLAERVVLRPHQGRAVAECPAHPLAVEMAV